jgi:type VI secretion system secreted protein VgrG
VALSGAGADAAADRPAPVPRAHKPGLFASANAAPASLNGAAGKFGAIAQAAQQAANAVQSLKKGGAQALLAPIGQMVPNSYGAASAGKPAAAASPLGLPASLPRIGAEVPTSF